MPKYYVKANVGKPIAFYSDDVHGPRQWPEIPAAPAVIDADGNTITPAQPAIAARTNSNCTIPADAVEISAAAYSSLLANQSQLVNTVTALLPL